RRRRVWRRPARDTNQGPRRDPEQLLQELQQQPARRVDRILTGRGLPGELIQQAAIDPALEDPPNGLGGVVVEPWCRAWKPTGREERLRRQVALVEKVREGSAQIDERPVR